MNRRRARPHRSAATAAPIPDRGRLLGLPPETAPQKWDADLDQRRPISAVPLPRRTTLFIKLRVESLAPLDTYVTSAVPSRRPAPTMVFTAIAATVVMLPWAAVRAPGTVTTRPAPATPDRPAATGRRRRRRDGPRNQPRHPVLDGRADRRRPDRHLGPHPGQERRRLLGALVRRRDLLSSGEGAASSTAPNPSSSAAPPRADRGAPSARRAAAPSRRRAPAARGLGYVPVTVEQPLAQNISAVLISPPQAPVDIQWTPPTAVAAAGQPPNIIGRAQWGADEAVMRQTGVRQPIRAAVVHHTAGSNDYQPQDSAGIVRSIFEYHTQTLGWCDIAYNALVDKYGQVFEGRAGGYRARRGRPHRRLQPRHLGCGDARQLRRRGADADPAAHPRPADRLAARHRPRRPHGHGRADLGGWRVHEVPPSPPSRCRRSSPTATSATPTAPATPPTACSLLRDTAAHFNGPPGPETWPRRCAAARSSTGGRRWAA